MATARRNNATGAIFDDNAMEHPFAEGSFRYVAKGKYTEGARRGEKCVCKWFKTGSVYEDSYYEADLRTAKKCIQIISRFNKDRCIDRIVRVNLPEVWEIEAGHPLSGTKVLQEPYIKKYQKFNSNSGWKADGFEWGRAMQALSLYSYHITGGKYLLCDLQGGVYKDGVILTDPVIMSRNKGAYGPTDLGPDGIKSFFANFEVNEYCQSYWRLPKKTKKVYKARKGTTMHHVGTRVSRQPMTHGGHY
ncbi:unnamed protein product [Cylindrotheca closterium]|uniref:Alpha-type protein kinase domain-containing protein n=1 Tax=Cylindrotheca closterium TaxID=2856 RepID=A0AAD2FP97_9STRA|nr:unnamed protein product [Cylindrotheca closterium]